MQRSNFYTALFILVVVLFVGLESAHSQVPTWTIVSSKVDADGDVTVVEQASDGQKRETKISFHKGTTKPEITRVTEIGADGSRIITTRSSKPDGTEKGYATEVQNERGVVRSGNRWFIDSTGQRFVEKWDLTRRTWIPSHNDAGPPVVGTRSEIRTIGWYTRPTELGWGTTPVIGNRISAICSANPSKSYASMSFPAYGTDRYAHMSSLCPAAVHAGAITFENGGLVTIEYVGAMAPANYAGSTRNEVTTRNGTGAWGGFVFVR